MSDMIIVTDDAYRAAGVDYVYGTTKRYVRSVGGDADVLSLSDRRCFVADVPDKSLAAFKAVLYDRVADVIAVHYKYDYFKRNVRVGGLKSVEYELLIAALIAADLEEDKRYARSLFSGERLAVDGFFNFTMKALKDKWRDVVGYVPAYFAPDQLKDFILYVAGEKKGGRLRVVGGRVYDEAYNLLSRAYLTGGGDCKVVKEVIISSPVEVLLTRPVPEKDEYYLKQFFGDKIVFDGNDKIYGH